jgi:hypothetical protein
MVCKASSTSLRIIYQTFSDYHFPLEDQKVCYTCIYAGYNANRMFLLLDSLSVWFGEVPGIPQLDFCSLYFCNIVFAIVASSCFFSEVPLRLFYPGSLFCKQYTNTCRTQFFGITKIKTDNWPSVHLLPRVLYLVSLKGIGS